MVGVLPELEDDVHQVGGGVLDVPVAHDGLLQLHQGHLLLVLAQILEHPHHAAVEHFLPWRHTGHVVDLTHKPLASR